MGQVNEMMFNLAELQSSLEVFKGLFLEKEDAEVLSSQFYEIGFALHKSLSTHLIIGCAALFTDPGTDKTSKNENLSFLNLYQKYNDKFSEETISLKNNIEKIIDCMNLKAFRNKYVGHFDLDHKLGNKSVVENITTHNLEELITKGQKLLNLIIRDAKLRPANNILAFYTPIPENRSVKRFLDRLRHINS